MILTVALGTTCPLGSATVPAIELEPCCACAHIPRINMSPATKNEFFGMFFAPRCAMHLSGATRDFSDISAQAEYIITESVSIIYDRSECQSLPRRVSFWSNPAPGAAKETALDELAPRLPTRALFFRSMIDRYRSLRPWVALALRILTATALPASLRDVRG